MSSVELTPSGKAALEHFTMRTPNLCHQRVILVESFAGIGGARRALELLSVKPAAYICIECDPDAFAIIRVHYPDAYVPTDIREVRLQDLLAVASGTPTADFLIHCGGSPCPGLCRWNAFRLGKQAAASAALFQQFQRVSSLCKQAWPSCYFCVNWRKMWQAWVFKMHK